MLSVWTWILLFTLSVLIFANFLVTTFYRKLRKGEPPLVGGTPLWGSATDFARDAVSFLHRSRSRFGPVFTIRLINHYLTIVMDPHSCDAVTAERNFDFDPIQKQVNWNVFSFFLHDAKRMVRMTGQTVRGRMMNRTMEDFSSNLADACANLGGRDWTTSGLQVLVTDTMFSAIFDTAFGRAENTGDFRSGGVFREFETFHRYFNYFWLGLPKWLFPPAQQSLARLLAMPGASELLRRPDLSNYLRTAIGCMLEHGNSEAEIKGHNLVYLHINYNTYRLAFWTLANLLEHPDAVESLDHEVTDLVTRCRDPTTKVATLTARNVEEMTVLDSVVKETCRLASGVFVVRYVKCDTMLTLASGQTYLIRRGDRIALYPPATHKDPDIFSDPQVFRYDRFIATKFFKDGKPLTNAIMPFGTLCPGNRVAVLQLKWYIIRILTQFQIKLADGQQPARYAYEYYGHEVLPPACDLEIKFKVKDTYPMLEFISD